MSKKPAQIEFNNNRMNKVFIKYGLFLFLFGLLLPTNWRQLFGIFGEPISWMAASIPSVRKIAEISPISELVQGFFGLAFLLLPFLYIAVTSKDSISLRFDYSLNRIPSKFKFFFLMYLLVVPALTLMLYVFFFLPIKVHLGLTPTRGQMLFSLMISYRFTLALFGTILIFGISIFLWILTTLLFGPLLYLTERMNHNGK